MTEIILIFMLGISAGIIVGLTPGLPSYIAPLLIFPFINDLSVDQLLIFWLSSLMGSQYFGSVAAVLLKIPGDASTLVYIKDVTHYNMQEKLSLIRQNAWGSTIGTVCALILLVSVYYLDISSIMVSFSSNNIKLTLLGILVFMLCFFSDHKLMSLGLFIFGFVISEKTNNAVPDWVLNSQTYFIDITTFSVILGLMLIPEFIAELTSKEPMAVDRIPTTSKKDKLKLKDMFRGTLIGGAIGLIPGPSHILAAIASYNSYPQKKSHNKIIAAESANNTAITTAMLPFFYVGLPITLSEMLMYSILTIKMFTLPAGIMEQWTVVPSLTILEMCFLTVFFSIIAYHLLSQSFLNWYAKIMQLLYGKLSLVYVVLIVYLIYIDMIYHPIEVGWYTVFLGALTAVGMWAHKRNINVMPMVFGYILGDMITWSLYHFYMIHFY